MVHNQSCLPNKITVVVAVHHISEILTQCFAAEKQTYNLCGSYKTDKNHINNLDNKNNFIILHVCIMILNYVQYHRSIVTLSVLHNIIEF